MNLPSFMLLLLLLKWLETEKECLVWVLKWISRCRLRNAKWNEKSTHWMQICEKCGTHSHRTETTRHGTKTFVQNRE
jgi:hypothetical protein